MRVCGVTENGRIKCQAEAESYFMVSCVHEHINRDATCGPHAARTAQLMAAGTSWECIDCRTGPHAHQCAAILDGPHPLAQAKAEASG